MSQLLVNCFKILRNETVSVFVALITADEILIIARQYKISVFCSMTEYLFTLKQRRDFGAQA